MLSLSSLKYGAGLSLLFCSFQSSVQAMDLSQAIEIALKTNPEIGEAAANKRAIDFEYEQARKIGNPHIIVEGRAGPNWVDSRTSRLFGNDEDILFGRQASITMQKNIYSFGRNNAEQDRQASRVDSASHRVYERSEFVGLDVAQSYFDILRLRKVLNYADLNVAFHQQMADDLSRGVASGLIRETDSLQAQERLATSMISRSEVEENHDLAMAKFAQLVGYQVGDAIMPPQLEEYVPKSLENALMTARSNNPTIKIAYADLDVARANYRAAKAETKPELLFEVSGRAGDHMDSFRDHTNDVRAQLVLKYEFRGGIKNSAVQEHLNWVDEQRQRIMTIERNVDNLVRNAWITKTKMQMRVRDLEQRVATGTKLRDDYQRERVLGNRSLLDILNAQEDLFQAQSSLVTAEFSDYYARYRLLASTGQLLDAFGLVPRREAAANLRDYQNVPLIPPAETEKRRHPGHYFDTTEMEWDNSGLRLISQSQAPGSKASQNMAKEMAQEFAKSSAIAPIYKTAKVTENVKLHSGAKPIIISPSDQVVEYGHIAAVETVVINNQPAQTQSKATPIVHLGSDDFDKLKQRADIKYNHAFETISHQDIIYMREK